jgi:uncharacterized protein (TIGR00299 family) protein
MKVLYFDCFAGIAGDMILGALIDLGLDLKELEKGLGKLRLGDYRLSVHGVTRQSIRATHFEVMLTGNGDEQPADAEFLEVDLTHHLDPHAHRHSSGGHEHPERSNHHSHRTLADILQIISSADLPARVKDRACTIFTRLGEAEARVHGQPADHVHLHEVGATDALVDVVGAVLGLELLGIDEVYASPLHLGSGFIKAAHGLLPVPAPATALLLQGIPVYSTQTKGELVTPTGAAVISAIAKAFGPLPLMKIGAIGHGAGSRDREFPNVLRVYLGDTSQAEKPDIARVNRNPYSKQHATPELPNGYHISAAIVIEANLDDMQPQLYESLIERLLEADALDVTLTQAQMKKNRPGIRLQVLAAPDDLDTLLEIIFTETTTIGVRTYEVQKRMLQRELVQVQTHFGQLQVKVAKLGNQVVNVAPEFEECRKLARQFGVAVKDVMEAALSAASQIKRPH